MLSGATLVVSFFFLFFFTGHVWIYLQGRERAWMKESFIFGLCLKSNVGISEETQQLLERRTAVLEFVVWLRRGGRRKRLLFVLPLCQVCIFFYWPA